MRSREHDFSLENSKGGRISLAYIDQSIFTSSAEVEELFGPKREMKYSGS